MRARCARPGGASERRPTCADLLPPRSHGTCVTPRRATPGVPRGGGVRRNPWRTVRAKRRTTVRRRRRQTDGRRRQPALEGKTETTRRRRHDAKRGRDSAETGGRSRVVSAPFAGARSVETAWTVHVRWYGRARPGSGIRTLRHLVLPPSHRWGISLRTQQIHADPRRSRCSSIRIELRVSAAGVHNVRQRQLARCVMPACAWADAASQLGADAPRRRRCSPRVWRGTGI